jgi:hypothetical protein
MNKWAHASWHSGIKTPSRLSPLRTARTCHSFTLIGCRMHFELEQRSKQRCLVNQKMLNQKMAHTEQTKVSIKPVKISWHHFLRLSRRPNGAAIANLTSVRPRGLYLTTTTRVGARRTAQCMNGHQLGMQPEEQKHLSQRCVRKSGH